MVQSVLFSLSRRDVDGEDLIKLGSEGEREWSEGKDENEEEGVSESVGVSIKVRVRVGVSTKRKVRVVCVLNAKESE